jgi:hypothetical protein
MYRHVCATLFLLAFFWVAGCTTSQGPKAPNTAKVSGTVKLDGKPMEGGEVHFEVAGFPAKSLEIKDGAFAGEVYSGKNMIGVVWNKEIPHPTESKMKMTTNIVANKFSGKDSPLNDEVTDGKVFTFEVTSAPKK